MRTTLTLDDDIFEAAQALAESSGKKIGQVLSQLARRGLRVETTAGKKNGLPVFQVGADAPVIPSNRAQKLLGEDVT